MTEDNLEQAIQDKNLTAPRLTPLGIARVIKKETFTMLPSMKVLVCELTLENGYTVRGEAAVVSPENFDLEIGQMVSRENARRKVWELEGYLLQQKLYEKANKVPLGTRDQPPVSVPANTVPQPIANNPAPYRVVFWDNIRDPYSVLILGSQWRYRHNPTQIYVLVTIADYGFTFRSDKGIVLPMNLGLIKQHMWPYYEDRPE